MAHSCYPMFHQASNFTVQNSQFSVFYGDRVDQLLSGTSKDEALSSTFKRLVDASSPRAFHNSKERFDAPKCHKNTRVAVLQDIMKWCLTTSTADWDTFILWLYGPAGAGKSAIVQTFAEQYSNIVLASFFFSRTDSSRNHQRTLAATLAYQITCKIPRVKTIIESAIKADPLVFERNFEAQFTTLVIEPLIQLSQTGFFRSTIRPWLILIDGLDECLSSQSQQNIVQAISTALQPQRGLLPIRFLISSRPEHHLTMLFSQPPLNPVTYRLALDSAYEPDAGIRRYLWDSFHSIRATHPLCSYIPSSWPTEDDINSLVSKSSGQFIYAATVFRYISSPCHNPMHRLKVVHGLLPPKDDKPYAQLDELYKNILSGVDDIEATLNVLGTFIFLQDMPPDGSPEELGKFMFLGQGDIQLSLLDLASVVDCQDHSLRFLHASFSDFLLDPARSLTYYINPAQIHKQIARYCMRHISTFWESGFRWKLRLRTLNYCFICITTHISKSEGIDDLRNDVLNMPYIQCLPAYYVGTRRSSPEFRNMPHTEGGIPYARGLLNNFLIFLKTSAFRKADDLYLEHRGHMDHLLRSTISNISNDIGQSFCIVFAGLLSNFYPSSANSLLDNLISLEDFYNIYPYALSIYLLAFNGDWSLMDSKSLRYTTCQFDNDLLYFLTDPCRAGPYILNQPRYATVANHFLEFVTRPFNRDNLDGDKKWTMDSLLWGRLLDMIPSILSKAGHMEELIRMLNHTRVTFTVGIFMIFVKEEMQAVVQAMGEYLMRVIGAVPVGFHIIIDRDWHVEVDDCTVHYIPSLSSLPPLPNRQATALVSAHTY